MSSVLFPQVFAQCTLNGTTRDGNEGRVPVVISSGAYAVVFSEDGRLGGVGHDGTSRPLTGKPLTTVGAQDLRHYANMARGCAGALDSPGRQVPLRQLAQELDRMAERAPGE